MYDEFFKPNLEMQGYKGVYKRRTGEEKHDGCAIFYHAEKFELKKTLPVDFNRGVEILDRDNVALLIMLQPKKVRSGIWFEHYIWFFFVKGISPMHPR